MTTARSSARRSRLVEVIRRSPNRLLLAVGSLVALVALLAGGCGPASPSPSGLPSVAVPRDTASASSTSDHLRVVVVRAAERAADDGDDPPLTATGLKRARHLADVLAGEPGVAVYVTPYQRTQSTAMPTANRWKVAPSLYDPDDPASELASRVRADNAVGTVLIVVHREDLPAVVGAFCDCGIDPLTSSDYGRLYRLTFDPGGALTTTERVENY